MLYKLMLLTLLAVSSLTIFSQPVQDEEEVQPWWEYGLNIGGYIPDNYGANFYNGTGDNDINRILNNQYRRQDIKRELGDREFSLGELPQNMQYSMALSPGFHIAYHSDSSTSFFINMQYVKLKTSGLFSLEITYQDETFDDFEFFNIYGSEERVNIDFGLRKAFSYDDKMAFYVMGGVNVNNTTVEENKINIGSLTYSIKTNYSSTDYVPGTPVNEYNIKQGGIGFGGFAGAGGQFYFENNLYIALDLTGYYTQTILPGREHFALQFMPVFRLGYQSEYLF